MYGKGSTPAFATRLSLLARVTQCLTDMKPLRDFLAQRSLAIPVDIHTPQFNQRDRDGTAGWATRANGPEPLREKGP